MSQLQLRDVKRLLDQYPLNFFLKPSEVFSINKKLLNTEIQKKAEEFTKRYLSAIVDLSNRRKYNRTPLGIKQWLSKIIEVLDALENIIRLCDNLSEIYQDESKWVKGLAIQRMMDILECTKAEISILKAQVEHKRQYYRVREQAYNLILSSMANLLDVLLITILVEEGEEPALTIVTAIGKSPTSQICSGVS